MFIFRKFLLWTFLIILLGKSAFGYKRNIPKTRITGGDPGKDHPYAKYVVSIRTNREVDFFGENHLCSGTIVSLRKILTAAHCIKSDIYKLEPEHFIVIAGSSHRLEWTPTSRLYNVSDLIVHPEYLQKSLKADIGIVVLDKNIEESSHIQIISIGDVTPREDTKCAVLGWGRIFHRGPEPDEILMIETYTWSSKICRTYFKKMRDCVICAGDNVDFIKSACLGDSGSPLICSGVLYGLISFGIGCGLTSKALDFFTDTSCFKDWIRGSTKNSNPSNINLLLGLSIILIRRN